MKPNHLPSLISLCFSLTFTALIGVSTTVNAVASVEPGIQPTQGSALTSSTAQSATVSPDATNLGAKIDSQAIRQQLVQVITSEDYAEAKEVKEWQRIEKPESARTDSSWLERLLRFLLGNRETNDGVVQFFSIALKVLFVGALLAFILWVARRARYLSGWVSPFKTSRGRRSSIEGYQPDILAQGWEHLPSHEHLPIEAQRLLEAGELTQSASLLYRGALRWLRHSQQLSIAPATTEQQCLAQIKWLNQSAMAAASQISPSHKDSESSWTYISRIITSWMEAAYDSQSRDQHASLLAKQLSILIGQWHQQLPINSIKPKASQSAMPSYQETT